VLRGAIARGYNHQCSEGLRSNSDPGYLHQATDRPRCRQRDQLYSPFRPLGCAKRMATQTAAGGGGATRWRSFRPARWTRRATFDTTPHVRRALHGFRKLTCSRR